MGSLCVVVSLFYLFNKRLTYWHWSNASLLPYFLLFVSGKQYMLASLQVTYSGSREEPGIMLVWPLLWICVNEH